MTTLQRILRIGPDARVMLGVLYAIALCVIGYLIAQQDFYKLGVLLIGIAGSTVLAFPRIGFYLFIVLLFIPIGFLERYFFEVPSVFRWLPHILLLVTTIIFVLRAKRSTDVTAKGLLPRYLKIFTILLAVLSILSAVYNSSSLLVTVLGLRYWLLLLVAFVLFPIALPTLANRRTMLKLLLTVGLIQLPVTLAQRFLFKFSGDMVTGSFSTYKDLMFLQVFCVMSVVIWWLKGERLLPASRTVVLALLLVPLILSNAKAAWLLLPACIIFVMRKHLFHPSRRSLIIVVSLSILVVLGALGFEAVFKSTYGEGRSAIALITSPDSMYKYLFMRKDVHKPVMYSRGEAVVVAYGLISSHPVTLLAGLGPGNLSHSHVESGLFIKSEIISRQGLDDTQVAIVLGEMGLVGIILVAWLLLALYRGSSLAGGVGNWIELRKATVCWVALLLPYYGVLRSLIVISVLAILFAPMITATHGQQRGRLVNAK